MDAFDKQHYRTTRHELTKARARINYVDSTAANRLQFAQGFSCEGANANGNRENCGPGRSNSTTARSSGKMAKTIAERQPTTEDPLKAIA